MATTFRLDPAGDRALLEQLAFGFSELGTEIASAVAIRAPRNTGGYARTISATTFLDGRIVSGRPVRGKGVSSKNQIWTVIYTNDPRGHLFELGTRRRTVVAKNPGGLMVWGPSKYGPGGAARIVEQPAMLRRPHFFSGLAAVIPRAGAIIGHGARARGGFRVNTKAL